MTKSFANFKEDLGFFCSENEIDNDKISIVGVSKKRLIFLHYEIDENIKEDIREKIKDES